MNKKKVKDLPKSQTTIASFFTKQGFSKLTLKKTKSVDETTASASHIKVSPEHKENTNILQDLHAQDIKIFKGDDKAALIEHKTHERKLGVKTKNVLNNTENLCDKNEDFIYNSPSKKLKIDKVDMHEALAKEMDTKIKDGVQRVDSGFCDVESSQDKKDNKEIDEQFDMLLDDMDFNEFDSLNMSLGDLDLSQWQTCDVIDVQSSTLHIKLKLKNSSNESGYCCLKEFWRNVTIEVGNRVSLIAVKDENNEFYISNKDGYFVISPDTLITGTDIVGSLYCMRKSLLQSNFRGIDSSNKYMVIGTLVHELFQICLINKHYHTNEITSACKDMLKRPKFVYTLYESGLSIEQGLIEMEKFIPQISEFMNKHVKTSQLNSASPSNSRKIKQWNGSINEIVDIEENIWSPKLGISGRIDVTVQVTIHNNKTKKILMPLELKTGISSNSAEHRGQVILYTMLMSEIEKKKGSKDNSITEGLLLYLKDAFEIHQITANHNEKRDLSILRNQLVYYMEKWKSNFNYEKVDTESEEQCIILPPPTSKHHACPKCPYLTLCSIYLSENKYRDTPNSHALIKLKDDAIGHLSKVEIDYFLHWCRLINIDEIERKDAVKKRDIWNIRPMEREKRGKCLSNMIVKTVICKENRFEHKFQRNYLSNNNQLDTIYHCQLQIGDYVVISSCFKYAEDSGFVTHVDNKIISISLTKNLTNRNVKSALYSIDAYDSSSTIVYNLTNLGLLMDNNETAKKLREMIINKKYTPSNAKISRITVDKAKDILDKLNRDQLEAVLKALQAQDYLLIKGMPGTGKTQTLVSLVELFVKLGKSVLITSQTHSAIDTVFLRLKDRNMKMLRLGSHNRIHPELIAYSEHALTECCDTPLKLENVYNSINIVGVTCLGSHHVLLQKRIFDVCIVDESTQVLQCSILRPLFAAKKIILVGDPDQLPPIVKNNDARSLGMDESLFVRLDGLGATVSLTLQYRMNKIIMELANRLTYKSQLKCANKSVEDATLQFNKNMLNNIKMKWIQTCLSTSVQDSVTLIDTGNTHAQCLDNQSLLASENASATKYTNVCETALIVHIVANLLKGGVSVDKIGVIAPYRDQVFSMKCIVNKHLQKMLGEESQIEINTVDQYQGRDKDVIIYSCTKTWKVNQVNTAANKEKQLLDDKRRLTVAITRAKYKLIIIGDCASLQCYKPFQEMFSCISKDKLGCHINMPEMIKDGEFDWNEAMEIL